MLFSLPFEFNSQCDNEWIRMMAVLLHNMRLVLPWHYININIVIRYIQLLCVLCAYQFCNARRTYARIQDAVTIELWNGCIVLYINIYVWRRWTSFQENFFCCMKCRLTWMTKAAMWLYAKCEQYNYNMKLNTHSSCIE